MPTDSRGPQPNTSILMKYWSPSELIWIKVNTDGTMPFNDDNASIGGVFRDTDGKWLCGYSMRMGKETVFHIEVRATLEGLRIAWEKGYRQLKVEYDNAFLVETFVAGSANSNNLVELRLINGFLKQDWKIRIRHISRSQNMVVDRMAKCVYYNPLGLILFEDPSISIQDILES
ncbi:hypothetical protein PVK06_023637 [Gossypium arboreum]|uniref:RNase H type-1 domain-containing protein n=1 Tax=Gossypium arboreum TaxID=29729 RepID=A0ABR0PBV9_GOSAR|nr:hypothetical protein PVK06_023637 [Gossypium arboreum]